MVSSNIHEIILNSVFNDDLVALRGLISDGLLSKVVNHSDDDGWSYLHLAAHHGNSEVVQMFIDAKADLTAVNDVGSTALHVALDGGLVGVANLLISAGADINAVNSSGWTPLHFALSSCGADMAKSLMEAGASVHTLTNHHLAPLYLAADKGYSDVVRLLVEAGADINEVNEHGWTPFLRALDQGHLGVAKVLLEAGADVNQLSGGHTPLSLVAGKNNITMARFLIEAGADVNAVDANGTGPVQVAAENDFVELLRVLIDAGAKVNIPFNDRPSPLFHILSAATRSPTSISKMFTLLTDAGATVDGATATISPLVPSDVIRAIVPDDTPFWLAANNDAPKLAAELAGGLDPNMKTENGMTLLHWACAGDAPECVQLLLDAGADKEAGDPKPIFYCMHESSECLQYLISAGSDVNQSSELNSETKYPIHLALAANSPACVTALVGAGAWVTDGVMRKDSYCRSALQLGLSTHPVPVDALRALLAAAGERVLSEEIDGMPPLHWAVENSTVDGVRVLVEGGANVNYRYLNRYTLLNYAEQCLSYPNNPTSAPHLTPIIHYLRSLPSFSETSA